MRSAALREEKSTYEKQRGHEKTLFKTMALSDGDGGDIGFIYFSNLSTRSTSLSDLPTLHEKIRFTELKGLELLNVSTAEEVDVSVPPGTEKIILMRKTEQAAYKAQFFPRLTYGSMC